MDPGFPTRAGGADEPLRWFVTPAAKRATTLSQMRSQVRFAAPLPPHARTVLGHASLTGQGWEESNAGAERGDSGGKDRVLRSQHTFAAWR